jgi:hypothetical protein
VCVTGIQSPIQLNNPHQIRYRLQYSKKMIWKIFRRGKRPVRLKKPYIDRKGGDMALKGF